MEPPSPSSGATAANSSRGVQRIFAAAGAGEEEALPPASGRVDEAALADVAETAQRLSLVVRYGDLRRFDPAPVVPLIKQLYLRACLTLADACVCDAKSAPAVTQAMDRLNAAVPHHQGQPGGRLRHL